MLPGKKLRNADSSQLIYHLFIPFYIAFSLTICHMYYGTCINLCINPFRHIFTISRFETPWLRLKFGQKWSWPLYFSSFENTRWNVMWYVTEITASRPISAKSLKALKYDGQYIMIASRYINTDALLSLTVTWSSILYTSFTLICAIFCGNTD